MGVSDVALTPDLTGDADLNFNETGFWVNCLVFQDKCIPATPSFLQTNWNVVVSSKDRVKTNSFQASCGAKDEYSSAKVS